ncbi:M48 family metalloprotease [Streptomyces sp. HNM0574]|uniref:M48 family metalloprotease n=1 Tax=Streptomyces sp. HNM0574 TaxID=2714954 RepID=UPI00146A0AAC|nr:M48 family metalloprotease [Streptomyces sp. HNM0574]NLU70731.1 M48 family metalloprotease [Streptomyces sp. HNM0574]
MTTSDVRSRFDERAIGAGTTPRFVLLLILLLVSSGAMMMSVSFSRLSETDAHSMGCMLAAGVDPNRIDDMASSIGMVLHTDALDACLARYAPESMPRRLDVLWPVLVVVASALVFRALPAWKRWRGRHVPLEDVDRTGAIRGALHDVVARAGLARTPRFVVAPTVLSAGAAVYGSTRRPTVCLHAGLLARRSGDPEGFRAVLLHEFAHVRNGDVTLTYATVALWRVFLALVLLPYLVWCVAALATSFQSPFRHAEQMTVGRAFILPAFLTLLVYLARADVLRMREVYADLAAVGAGADPRGWAAPVPPGPEGRFGRGWARFAEVWRTHPRWDLRRGALEDPAMLFGVQALPMFLTGISTVLLTDQAGTLLSAGSGWPAYLVPLLGAVAVTGVAGIALWRAVAHAVLTEGRVPSGVRAGLWLGAGMAIGAVVTRQVSVTRWLPPHPEVLLLVVAVGVLFAWWTTEASQLWLRAWPRRGSRPAMLLVMAAGCLLLTAWTVWWETYGINLVGGWFDMDAARRETELTFPGPIAEHRGMVSALSVWFEMFAGFVHPLVLAAVCALCVVPLPAWATGRTPGGDTGPPLRPVLLAALLGGLACWGGIAAAKAYMHTWQPESGERGGLYAVSLSAWVLVVLVAFSATTGAVLAHRLGRHPFHCTLLTAELTALTGLLGYYLLMSVDGCVQPLSTLASRCHWSPGPAWTVTRPLLAPVLVSTALVAAVAAAAVLVLQRLRRAEQRRPVPVRQPSSRRRLCARRAAVAAICAVTVSAVTVAAAADAGQEGTGDGLDKRNQAYSQVPRAAAGTPVIRRAQLEYWLKFGGGDLMNRFADAHQALGDAFHKSADAGGVIKESVFAPICRKFGRVAKDAGEYFPIPDARAGAHWKKYNALTLKAAKSCPRSFDHGDEQEFNKSMDDIDRAAVLTERMGRRFDEIRAAAP